MDPGMGWFGICVASFFQAAWDDSDNAMKGEISSETEPKIALKMSWSWRIQNRYAGLGISVLFSVMVFDRQGVDPSI